ncbi:hypothetical protein ACIA8G_21650 [Lentzea sp. NPDC051213]|uniref:hypothetical protein n=1 Tax=Lentzea sp. NPDC051213 TaxID=3364126 RepID=UPI0037B8507C
MIGLITAIAALVFVVCLARMALRRRQRMESAHVGVHRRAASQPPIPALQHAIATVGTRGLSMIREAEST